MKNKEATVESSKKVHLEVNAEKNYIYIQVSITRLPTQNHIKAANKHLENVAKQITIASTKNLRVD